MARNTIELEFADGTYLFALPVGQITELETKCQAGIGPIFRRVCSSVIEYQGKTIFSPDDANFYILDIIETIRLGLIGGGAGLVNGADVKVSPLIAQRLVTDYVLPQPLEESCKIAAAILHACVIGFDPPKKDPPGSDPAKQTMTEGSTTAGS